jgi:hypothetical protein
VKLVTAETPRPERRILPIECSSIRYTCEQIEDTISRFHSSIDFLEECKANSIEDLQRYKNADYFGDSKDSLIKSAKESIEQDDRRIVELRADIDRLLSILESAKALERVVLGFWQDKDKSHAERR